MRATDHVRPCPLLVGFEALPRTEAVGPMLKQPLERGRRPRPASGRVLTPVAVRAWPTVRSSAPCRRMEWATECTPSVSFASSGMPNVLSGSGGCGLVIWGSYSGALSFP